MIEKQKKRKQKSNLFLFFSSVGFRDPRQYDVHPIEVEDPELRDIVGNARFFSVTFRLFKLASLERLCEDYGQVREQKNKNFSKLCFPGRSLQGNDSRISAFVFA